MVSTQDFAREVWVSLENIRERLAVVETEIRHARRDMVRLEGALASHLERHNRSNGCNGDGDGNGDDSNPDVVHLRFNRKLLGGSAAGAGAAATAALGRMLGWW